VNVLRHDNNSTFFLALVLTLNHLASSFSTQVANGQQVVQQPYADLAGDAAVEVRTRACCKLL